MAKVANRFDLLFYWFCPNCNSRQGFESDPNHAEQLGCIECGTPLWLVGKPADEFEDRPAPPSLMTDGPRPAYNTGKEQKNMKTGG